MTNDQEDLLLEARDSLSAAKVLLENGYPGYSASRAYYCMFYIAEAFLEGEGLAYSKHSAVISSLWQYFCSPRQSSDRISSIFIESPRFTPCGGLR
ncbi:MAG: HEPN domain-containing protein [Phycisphaerae bacterium]